MRACCVEVEGASERGCSCLRERPPSLPGRGGGCCLCLLLQLQRPLAICRRRCRSLLPSPLPRPPTSPLLPLRPRDRSVADDEGEGERASDDEFRHCETKKTTVQRE